MAEGFVLTSKLIVEWPVKVRVPRDGGRFAEQQFTATFQLMEHDEFKKLEYDGLDIGLLEAALTDAKGIKTPEGEAVAFDDEVKRLLIQLPHTRMGLINAYNEATAGRRAKN